MIRRAIIYSRFSPRRNAEDSESIETQVDLCRAYCERQGYTVVAAYEDRALSGSEEDRPGLWSAVEALKRGDVLLAYKLDRLARDVYLSELIQREAHKRGATIETVDGGANGHSPEQQMIRQVLQAFAEYERKVIAARTRAAMPRHQSNGRRMSDRTPYGWSVDPNDPSKLTEEPSEQALIARIVEMRVGGPGLSGDRPQTRRKGPQLPKRGLAPHDRQEHLAASGEGVRPTDERREKPGRQAP